MNLEREVGKKMVLTKSEKKKIESIEELCVYLNGGGLDTSEIEWLIKEYLKLKAQEK